VRGLGAPIAHTVWRASLIAGVVSVLLVAHVRPLAAQRIALEARVSGQRLDLDVPSLPVGISRRHLDLARALAWRTLRPGVQLAELELRAGAIGIPVHALVLRVDQRRVKFALQLRSETNGMTGAWRVDSMPADAVFGMNAGQFKETGPWGWLLLDGESRREPGRAPLAASVGIDSVGHLRFLPSGAEHETAGLRFGFQSFPRLLDSGRVPRQLGDPALVDRGHRDARLVLAAARDGTVMFILTRFGGLGAVAGRVPIGLTTPESLVLAIALGAHDAVMLDGGISGQLLVRDSAGVAMAWRGMRSVPLGLIARAADPH